MLGHKLNLTAYTRGVLAYVDGRCLLGKDVYFLGCESRFTGQFLAYNGEVLVAGDRNRVDGSIYSNTFDMIGLCNTIAAPATWSCDPAPTGAPSAPVPTTTPTPSAAPTAAPTPAPTPTPAPATPAPTPTPPGGGQPVDPTPGPGGTQGSGGPGQPSGSTWSINSGGNPFGLALDQDQNLWVTHCSAYVDVTRIHRASGATLNDVQVGYNGHELAFDANRRLTWLTINGDQLIYGLNADGSIAFRSSPGWKPEGVALDANGRAWVCDVGEGLVWQLDPTDGHALAAFSVGDWTTQPRGIAIDQAGHAWVTLYAAKQLVELAADGTVLGTFPTDTNPSKVAVDGQGNVWVTGTGADIPYPDGTQPGQVVMKFSSSGQRLGTFRVGDSPYGLAFDRQGNVLVVNTGTSNVTKLSPGGQVLATYPVGLHPYNVVVDREGYAWVSNFDDGTITKLVP
jgi:streptogramin lyase